MALTRIVAARSNGTTYDANQPNNSTESGGNGGSVAKAASTNTLDGVAVDRYDAGVFGSTVVDGDSVNSAISGTLAYNNQSPIAKRITTKINTSNNDVLLSGAAQPDLVQSVRNLKILNPIDSSSYLDGTRTIKTTAAIRSGAFNLYTGKFVGGYPQHSDDYFLGADGVNGDRAAKPTRAVPGTLTFKSNSPDVLTRNYSEKTG